MDFQNILFPVDFSERCRAVVPQVKAMARLFDSTVFLLHVVEGPNSGPFSVRSVLESDWIDVKTRAAKALVDLARNGFDGLTVVPVVRQGDPAAEIVSFAQTRGIDLIMMPTHGAGRLRSALLGSVTAKVLHDTPCHVWTSAHSETAQLRGTEIRSILCAIDLSHDSRSLVRAADSLGSRTGAKVRLVHAVPGEEVGPQRGFNVEFDRYLKDRASIDVARLQRETGTAFDLCMEAGRPSRVIEAVAHHHDADLVLVGRGQSGGDGPDGLVSRLRSETYSIIRDSPCPVLSF
jgi:nucleotide-binding universal stress UspA family protein